jgi:hypothetical protein
MSKILEVLGQVPGASLLRSLGSVQIADAPSALGKRAMSFNASLTTLTQLSTGYRAAVRQVHPPPKPSQTFFHGLGRFSLFALAQRSMPAP